MIRAVVSGILLAAALPFVWPWAGSHPAVPGGWNGILAFVALVPLLWSVEGRRPWRGFFHGFLAGIVGFSLIFYWINIAMTTFGGLPDAASIPMLGLLVLYCSVYWGVPVALAVRAKRDLGWPLWVVLPPAWVGAEIVRNYLFSGYPWGNVGYTLAQLPHLVQIAALGGVYLVAGLVVLVNAVVYESARWLFRGRPAEGRRPVVTGLAVAGSALILSAGYSAIHLHLLAEANARAKRLDVALIQGNIDQKIKNAHGEYGQFIIQSYIPLSEKAAEGGADLVVWPEAAYPYTFPADGLYFSRAPGLKHLAGLGHAWFLVSGVTQRWKDRHRLLTNTGFLLDNALSLVGRYDKHHLVPFGEYVPLAKIIPLQKIVPDFGSFVPGSRLVPLALDSPEGKLGIGDMICYDGIFPEIGRAYGGPSVGILVNQTNDAWYGFSSAPWQFLHMVAMRAIETGRWVARAANTGVTAFIAPSGRVVAHTPIGLVHDSRDTVSVAEQVPPVMLRRKVPILHDRTVYTVVGDTYAYLCLGFAAVVLGLSIVRKGRAAAAGDGESKGASGGKKA